MRIGVLPWNSVDIQAVLQNMDMIEEGTLTTVGAYKEDQNRIAKSMHIDVCGTQNLNIDNVDALIVYLERKYQRLEPWNKIIQQSYLAGEFRRFSGHCT